MIISRFNHVEYNLNLKSVTCMIATVIVFTVAMHCSGANDYVIITIDLLTIAIIPLEISLSEASRKYASVISIIIASTLLYAILQLSIGAGLKNILYPINVVEGILICLACLFLGIFITGRVWLGITIISCLLLLFSTVDAYVVLFRGTEILLYDFISIPTALNVVNDYSISLIKDVVISWVILTTFLLLVYKGIGKQELSRNKSIVCLIVTVITIIIISRCAMQDIKSYRWGNQGSMYNGLLVNLVLQLKETVVSQPEGYNATMLEKSVEKYEDSIISEPPDIIVIMNESFGDFREIGNCETDKEFLQFWDSMDNNTQKGFCYASIFGGKTSCSEYEFLTGNTLAFLPNGCIPYQQYIGEKEYSMVAALKEYGYDCVAMHPFYSNGWNRINAYKDLGFNNVHYIEDFPQKSLIRGLVSDKEMYRFLLSKYKERDKNKPYFAFGVTMQNHGGWDYEGYKSNVHFSGSLKNKGYEEEEQYLSLIRESDKAFKELINTLREEEDKVIVVMFGDHLPGFDKAFYDDLHDSEIQERDINEYSVKLKVPFVIWANFDIEEKAGVETSLNYLANHVYEIAGFEPAYNNTLKDIEEVVPIINAYGYYSNSEKKFLPIDEAKGKEKEAIDYYRQLQYNNIFDKKHHLPIFN